MALRGGRARDLRAAALALGALLPLTGRAEGLAASLEPGYQYEDTEVTDQAGKTTRTFRNGLTQNYRLQLDADLFRNLTFTTGGSFREIVNWTRTGGTPEKTDDKTTGLFARLNLGTPILTAGLGYDRRVQSPPGPTDDLVNEVVSASASWRPLELPSLDLRIGQAHTFDEGRRVQDSTVTSASLGARWALGPWDGHYTLSYTDSDDVLNRVDTSAVDQVGQVTYTNAFLDRRVWTYFTATGQARSATSVVSGPGGKVETQRFPVAGYSLVEAFTDLPSRDTLAVNAAVVDGIKTDSASVDLGFGRTLAGDTALRDIGVQMADVVTDVNTLYLWVDKQLPPAVVQGLAAQLTAWRSDDNAQWTQVNVGAVTFPAFQNRLEISIDATQARYLKVVSPPLAASVTTDPAFQVVAITELQVLWIVDAAAVPRHQSSYNASVNGTVRTAILRSPSLAHDLSFSLTRQDSPGLTLYTVANGLTFAEKLGRVFGVNARILRQDQDSGHGHEASWQWSGSFLARPLPTLTSALTYSGQANETRETGSQSLTLFGRADLYEGVSAQANVGGNTAVLGEGRVSRGVLANANLALRPNPWLAFQAAWTFSWSYAYGGAQADSVIRLQRVDASASFTPAAGFSALATVGRVIQGFRPTTLATVQVAWSPLRGDLQLSLGFSRTLDTGADSTTQTITPTLRWMVRRGTFLNASYVDLKTRAPVERRHTRVFLTSLLVLL
jgi:hypothetical protein